MSEIRQFIKYPNRRLYCRMLSSYVTLADIAEVIDSGKQVEVIDRNTRVDMTREILWEILKLREVANSTPKLSVEQLLELIRP